jgi:hypothetical protein
MVENNPMKKNDNETYNDQAYRQALRNFVDAVQVQALLNEQEGHDKQQEEESIQ